MSSQEWLPESPEQSGGGGSDKYDRIADWPEVARKVGKKSVMFKERRCRILGPGVGGLLAWSTDNKPFRFSKDKPIPADFKFRDNKFEPGKKERPVEFLAYPAWVYPGVRIVEMAKWGLTSNFRKVVEKWGRPDGYDIVLVKGEDEKGKVVYDCDVFVPDGGAVKFATPPEALAEYAALVAAGFDISRLLDGGDPFPSSYTAPAPVADSGPPF